MSDAESPRSSNSSILPAHPLVHAAVAIAVALGLFALAMVLSRTIGKILVSAGLLGGPATVSRLLANTFALQLLGFGLPAALFVLARKEQPRGYFRLTSYDAWTAFYGTAVGLSLMILTVVATVLFTVLGISPAESTAGQATDPAYYTVLFVVSSAVAVPMEELFFRGLLQRRLTDGTHPIPAILLTSLLFASIHSTISVGSGGAVLAFGLFVSFGVVLGVAYHRTNNLFVPIIGHVVFNGVQILVRGLEVAV
jgi:membrane protease YdiL (CAAX protease family)